MSSSSHMSEGLCHHQSYSLEVENIELNPTVCCHLFPRMKLASVEHPTVSRGFTEVGWQSVAVVEHT